MNEGKIENKFLSNKNNVHWLNAEKTIKHSIAIKELSTIRRKDKERIVIEKQKVPRKAVIKLGLFKGNYRRNLIETKVVNNIATS